MTTIQFPDVSTYTQVSLAGAVEVIARATIGLSRDGYYSTFKSDAANRGIPFSAYHFINSGSLGASATAQADFALSVIGAGVPTMLDLEPNRGACASLAEGLTWIDRFRSGGGVCHLCYLPHWSWQGNMGSPSLIPLAQRGVGLVSSNYTTYSDTGPGWNAYGGVVPMQWQFSSTHSFNGMGVDWNAFRGDVSQYWNAVNPQGGFSVTDSDNITITTDKVVNWLDPRIEALFNMAPNAVRGNANGSPNMLGQFLVGLKADVAATRAANDAGFQAVMAALASGSTAVTPAQLDAIMKQAADTAHTAVHQEVYDQLRQVLTAAENALPQEPTP